MDYNVYVQLISMCVVNIIFLWDRFKYIGDSQYSEIVTTSKETMSFHDYGVVVCRFGLTRNKSSGSITLSYLLVKRGLLFVTQDKDVSVSC